MCKALDNLTAMVDAVDTSESLEPIAEKLLDYISIHSFPVDIKKLLSYWGISVLPADFTKLQETPEFENKATILGAVGLKNADLCIYYKHDELDCEINFTLAHELAHCCLDKLHGDKVKSKEVRYRFEKEDDDEQERAADILAGAILMPERIVRSFFQELIEFKIEDFERLFVRLFKVPKDVVKKRLEILKLQNLTGDA